MEGAGKGTGKGTGKDTCNKKPRGRANKLPPSCFSAITKLAAAPAVGPTEVNTDKPQHNPLELDQWEQEEDDKGESAASSEKQLSDVD